MIVGTAEVVVVMNTAGARKELEDGMNPAFAGIADDAEVAGADAGAALRTGVRDGASDLEKDMSELGAASGVNLREGVREGASDLDRDMAELGAASGVNLREGVADGADGLEKDLQDVGSLGGQGLRVGVKDGTEGLAEDLAGTGVLAGQGLREGVTDETAKLGEDVGRDAEDAGSELHRGIGDGLSKLASLIATTGLPLEGLSAGLEKAGDAAKEADGKTERLGGTLDKVGGVAMIGFAAAGAVVAGAGVHIAEKMQTAEASIASAGGISVAAADKIGAAFDGTAFKSEASGNAMAAAYALVAGQLRATEGHALSASQALQVMTASQDLAAATGGDLATTTSTVASVMQAFQLHTGDAAHVSDVLYSASQATGQSVDSLGASLEKVRSKLGDTAGSIGDLSGLLVDMTKQGITGRAAMSGLNGAMNTLQKTGTGVSTAVTAQKAAYDQMDPSLQRLARSYQDGSITSKDFSTATQALPPRQAALASAFATASTAVQSAQSKLKEAGVTAFDAQGKFVGMGSIIEQLHPKFEKMSQAQQLAAASTIFGASAARQMTQVIDAGPAAYDAATAGVNRMGAAHDAAAKQAATLHGEEHTLEAGMEDLAGRIGSLLIPILTSLVGAFASATAFVVDHKAVLIALAAVVTGVLGPAMTVFAINKMASFAQSFVTAGENVAKLAAKLPILSAGFAETGVAADELAASEDGVAASGAAAAGGFDLMAVGAAALDAVPIVALIAGIGLAIAALVVGIVELVDHWKTVWKTIEAVVKTVAAVITGEFHAVVAGLESAWHAIEGAAVDAFDFIKAHWQLFAAILLGPIGIAVAAFFEFKGTIVAIFTDVVDAIRTAWDTVKSTTETVVDTVVGFFSTLPTKLLGFLETILGAFTTAWGTVRSISQTLVAGIVTFFSTLPGKLLSFLDQVVSDFIAGWARILAGAETLITTVVSFFAGLPGKALAAIGSLVSDVEGVWSEILTDAGNLISSVVSFFAGLPGKALAAIQSLISDVQGVWSEILTDAGDLITGVVNTFARLPGKVMAAVGSLVSDFTSLGGQVIQGLVDGIESAAGRLESVASSVAHAVESPFKKILGILSPSTVFAQHGRDIVQGLVNGIMGGLGQVTDASQAMATAANSRMGTGGSAMADMVTAGGSGASGQSIIQQVASFFGAQGFNRTAIAGLLGNAAQESSMNPNTPGGGMWQQISNFGQGTGGSLLNQMQTMLPQIMGIRGILNNSSSPAAAALAFENLFERPKGTAPGAGATTPDTYWSANTAHRESAAEMYYGQLGGVNVTSSATAPATAPALTAAQKREEAALAAAETAADKVVTERMKLADEIQQETSVTDTSIAAIKAGLKPKTTTTLGADGKFSQTTTKATATDRVDAAGQIAALKASLGIEVAQQKGALDGQTAAQKAELSKQSADVKAGTSVMAKLVAAEHSGSLTQIQKALVSAHEAGITKIEHDLDRDHNSHLTSLAKELEAIHRKAMDDFLKQSAANAKAAATAAAATAAANALTAQIAGIQRQTTLIGDAAKSQADQIADATKVTLDQAAAVGLTGAALIAANAQTHMDQVTQAANAAIDAAQTGVDEAASGSQLAQAQAANVLAQAQAAATVNEAQAQSDLDKANAAAKSTSTATSTSTTNSPTMNFNIYGNGQMTASQLIGEAAFAITTGALPVAPPVPAVA